MYCVVKVLLCIVKLWFVSEGKERGHMKKMIISVIVGLVGVCHGYEVPQNPDRKISFGVTYNRDDMSGDYGSKYISLKNAGNLTMNNVMVDARVPLSSWFTFTLGGGYRKTALGLGILDTDERWNMGGYSLSVGARFYLP